MLLLLCATPGRRARQRDLVLQLPPSMSPDAFKDLIADLAAKGAPARREFS
jgi:hypothetical protein